MLGEDCIPSSQEKGLALVGTASWGDIEHKDLAALRLDPVDNEKVADSKGAMTFEGFYQWFAQFRILEQSAEGVVQAGEESAIGAVEPLVVSAAGQSPMIRMPEARAANASARSWVAITSSAPRASCQRRAVAR